MGFAWKEWRSHDVFDQAKVTVQWKDRLLVGHIHRTGGFLQCTILNYQVVLGENILERYVEFPASTEEEAKRKIETVMLNIMH